MRTLSCVLFLSISFSLVAGEVDVSRAVVNLGSEDAYLADRACNRLIERGEAAIEALLSALRDTTEPEYSMRIVLTLNSIDSRYGSLCGPFLAHPDPDVRRRMLFFIRRVSWEEPHPLVSLIRPLLEDSEQDVQGEALKTLAYLKDESVFDRALEALDSEDEMWDALDALADLGDARALSALEELMNTVPYPCGSLKGDRLRRDALRAMQACGEVAADSLFRVLERSDCRGKAFATRVVQGLHHPETVRRLLWVMQDTENCAFARWEAARALGELGDPDVIPHLVETLKDPCNDIRIRVIEALKKFKEPALFDVFVGALEDEGPIVRWTAAEALGLLGNPDAIGVLGESLQDPSATVREYAVRALGKFDDPRVEPMLREHVQKETDPDVLKEIEKILR